LLRLIFFIVLTILIVCTGTFAAEYPPNSHRNILGTGWECDRGFYQKENKCIPVQVPEHAHINILGNGWECDRGFYQKGNQCTPVQVPEHAHINILGNGWECDHGYHQSGTQCIAVNVPANAHVNILGNGWECDKNYRMSGNECIPMSGQEIFKRQQAEKAIVEELLKRRKGVSRAVGNSCRSSEDAGVVVKEDVCGSGNSIIETTDGWYIAAEHYSGVYLYEGDIVCGQMKTYCFQQLYRSDGTEGRFYIEDWESSIEDAFEELCD
jgi:hypothetical protein